MFGHGVDQRLIVMLMRDHAPFEWVVEGEEK
jgi:hypothetical protein